MVGWFTTIPGVPFDEAYLAAFYSLRTGGKGEATDVDALSCDGVDRGADPQPITAGLDLEVVLTAVYTVPFKAAGYSGTPISSGVAVRVSGSGSSDKAGEDPMKHGLAIPVRAWLDARVPDVVETDEAELLSEVVAGNVVCLDDGDGESDISEAARRYVRHGPGRPD